MSSSRHEGALPLEKLLGGEVDKSDLRKLRIAGFDNVESIARAPADLLESIPGLSPHVIEEIQEAIRGMVPSIFRKASNYMKCIMTATRLTTGCKVFDGILGGGLERGRITEIFGDADIGKTQLCHTLSISCQLPTTSGGLAGGCLYIDTANTFRPERLYSIAMRFGMDPMSALDKVEFARAYSTRQQFELLDDAQKRMAEGNFTVLVVDSATNLYRSEYYGRADLPGRQQHIGKFLHKLQQIADKFNVVVVVTNYIVTDAGNRFNSPINKDKPGGGNVMGNACQTRLQLRKGLFGNIICKIYGSPSLPNAECSLKIENGGIIDA